MGLQALRHPLGAFAARHPVLGALLVALLALLALALLWHLVGMDHAYPGGMLGGCIVVLAVLLLVSVRQRTDAAWLGTPRPSAPAPASEPPGPAPRAPPARTVVRVTVLRL